MAKNEDGSNGVTGFENEEVDEDPNVESFFEPLEEAGNRHGAQKRSV